MRTLKNLVKIQKPRNRTTDTIRSSNKKSRLNID